MERVLGIGGFFFRSKNPASLAQWYKEKLGIDLVPRDYNEQPWSQAAGSTVFAPFAFDTDYFGNMEKQWMINFRVGNFDAMAAQLRAQNIEVRVDSEVYPRPLRPPVRSRRQSH
jgi:glyoxylase I family protein